jgi:CheY-like chemotaxis protein
MACKSVLVVEDDRYIQESLRMFLEAEGYSVFSAYNGQEALQQLANIPKPCLILLDLMMPVMTGWEFLQSQKQDVIMATIPVIVVSAMVDSDRPKDAAGFIKKPIDLDRLIATVEKYCGMASERADDLLNEAS